ncbi:MAG: tetratricopeptide repeat protein, partial [Flavobacteriales bacterium]
MRRSFFRVLLPALAVVTVVACSTDKDAWLNRTFHKLVTRDNGWFNANEKLKETVDAMQKAYVDDYDQVLPIFVIGTEDQAKAIVPDMETCIAKCALVIDRNSMDIGGKEKNSWIPDAWFVIGKSHFYKRSYMDAERTFDYIGRRYKGDEKQLEAKLWLARTAIQLEEYAKARSALDEIKKQKKLPKHFPQDQLSAVDAQLQLRLGKVDDAIISLERAVQIGESKQDRVRWSFILAQLYQLKGQEDKAIAQFNKVTRMGPSYEMGFHAQIFQALAF